MAYVPVSPSLIETVRKRIHYMRDTEIQQLGDYPKIPLYGDESWVINQIWGEYVSLYEQTPQEWCRSVRAVDVQVTLESRFTQEFRMQPQQPYRAPPNYPLPYVDVSLPEDLEAGRQLAEYAARRAEIQLRWDTVEVQVLQYLKSCKSVNEAVKLWPQIEVYLPEGTAKKIFQKKERSQAASRAMEVLKELDTDVVMASAVAARMAGAQLRGDDDNDVSSE